MYPCCLWATQEQIDGDPEQYDCANCTVREHLDDLAPENRAAWALFRQLATRLTADVSCGAEVLRRLTGHIPDPEWPAVWRRLSVLYDVLMPPPDRKG